MKKYLLLYVLFIAVFAFSQNDTIDNPYWRTMMLDRSINFYKTWRAYELYYSNKPKLPKTGWKAFERWADHAKRIINPDGTFPPSDQVLKEYKKFKSNNIQTRSSSGSWTSLGPFGPPAVSNYYEGGTGRISAIAFHPTDPNTIFIGAPQGGFWITTNKGASWTTTTDNMPTLGVSAIVVIPTMPLTILIGTGDRDAGDANGLGVYKSIDGGLTFTSSNSIGMSNLTVNKMLLNPLNSNTIVAATDGGIYISYNQGSSWSLKTSSSLNMKDLQYKPGDTTTLYSCSDGTFYRSTNGGTSWTSVTTGFSATTRNRLAIGVSIACPNSVFVLASKSSGSGFEALYKSSNSGVSFSSKSTSPNVLDWNANGTGGTTGQGWYDLAIATSNLDSNMIFTGGVNIFKSTTGGNTGGWTCSAHWTGNGGTMAYVHADIHVFERNPINNELYVGSDGGLFFTADNGATWNSLHGNMTIRQLYDMDVSAQNPKKIITGAQDNGTDVLRGTSWSRELGGDGMDCGISQLDSNKMVGSQYNGSFNATSNNGASWSSIGGAITETGPWVTPFALHPRVANNMIILCQNAWRSTNCFAGGAFSKISTGSGIGTSDDGSAVAYSNISDHICFIANVNKSTGVASFRKSGNILSASPTWTTITPSTSINSGSIRSITSSYSDSNLIFIAQGNKVLKSPNGGINWVDISANLPNIKMFAIAIDKYSDDRLYVGTQAGVYMKDNGATNWVLFNSGMPASSEIRKLVIWYDTACSNNSKISATTYGRGTWQSDLYTSQSPVVDFSVPTTACTGTAVNFTNNTTNNPDSFAWKITPTSGIVFNGGTTFNSASPNVTFNNPGTYTIELYAKKTNYGYCSLKKTNIITIGNAGSLTLSHGDTSFCGGDTILYTASGAVNYSWSPASGLSATSGTNVKVSPTSTTTYTVISDMGSGVCPDTVTFTATVQTAPGISKVGLNKICNGDQTKIIIIGADSAFWSPTFGLNLSSRGDTATASPNTTKNYTIKVKKTGYCDVYLTHKLTVLPIPSYIFGTGKDTIICKGDSVLRNVTSPTKIHWTPNYKLSKDTGSSVVIKTDVTQKYFVYSADTTLCPRTDSFTISVNPSPSLVLSGPSAVCKGSTIQLSATGATNFVWSPATYLDSTNKANVNCKPDTDITYIVTASIGVCTQMASKSISVGSGPLVVKITGNTTLCSGSSTKLKVTGGSNYVWTPNNILSAGFGDSVWATPSIQNTKVVVSSSKNGCVGSDSVYLNMLNAPILNVNVLGPSAFCAGDSSKLTASGASSYVWTPSFGLTSPQLSTTSAKPTVTTTYVVRGYNSNNCMSLDSLKLTVYPLPVVTVSPPVATIYRGDSITLTASGASTYLWRPSKYLRDTVNASVISKPDSNIIYTVQGTSINNCKSSAIAIIYVLKKNNPVGGITPFGTQTLASIYPNPASDELHIEATEALEYSIVGMLGNVLQQGNVEGGKSSVSIDHIASGSYVIVLLDKAGNSYIEKLIIQK